MLKWLAKRFQQEICSGAKTLQKILGGNRECRHWERFQDCFWPQWSSQPSPPVARPDASTSGIPSRITCPMYPPPASKIPRWRPTEKASRLCRALQLPLESMVSNPTTIAMHVPAPASKADTQPLLTRTIKKPSSDSSKLGQKILGYSGKKTLRPVSAHSFGFRRYCQSPLPFTLYSFPYALFSHPVLHILPDKLYRLLQRSSRPKNCRHALRLQSLRVLLGNRSAQHH